MNKNIILHSVVARGEVILASAVSNSAVGQEATFAKVANILSFLASD